MGQVRLVSNVWNQTIPDVEIREGKFLDPEQNQLVYRGPVAYGQWFLSAEGVTQSYRRSTNPSDPASPLGYWNSNSRMISGTEDWSLG